MDNSVHGRRACHVDGNLLCLNCTLPLAEPRQALCGDRVCCDCYSSWHTSGTEETSCSRCGSPVKTNECFRDRAAEGELRRATFQCIYHGCPWSGSNTHCRAHVRDCKFAPVVCPNVDCGFTGRQGELVSHLEKCPAQPVKCLWCDETIPRNKEEEHVSWSCMGASVDCSAGCGEQVVRREMRKHLEDSCPKQKRSCHYSDFSCNFAGDRLTLATHEQDAAASHLRLVADSIRDGVERDSSLPSKPVGFHTKIESTVRQVAVVSRELSRLHEEMEGQLGPMRESLLKLETTLADLQESFSDLSLMVQTLQATSYTGKFIWKVPELSRRKREAIIGKIISLYSAPFFTSRFGYRMCLRLYLNGDGSGKGTHLSFFLTIMRGEYDALLSWPFKQMVTLMLLDQDKKNDIVQCFRPDPSSPSFWKPKAEMNVASGCPKFAPLSLLDNPSYSRNDTLYLKVMIDSSGLDDP